MVSLFDEDLHEVNGADMSLAHNAPDAKPRLDQILKGLKDPKSWLGGLAIGAAALNIAAFSSFLPTFVHEFGFSPRKSKQAAWSQNETDPLS